MEEEEFPWQFHGRVRFRPALVSCPRGEVAEGVRVLSLLGTTLGGSVCLEYDSSPVGPYLEVVEMSAAVLSERLWTAALWGRRLMVSDAKADEANGKIWGVPSEQRSIAFEADGAPGVLEAADGTLRVGGWGAMRFAGDTSDVLGTLPIWWTPTLKALWLPFSLWRNAGCGGTAPVRRLRLSASSLRLRWAPPGEADADMFSGGPSDEDGFRVPLPFVIEADGVRIEIGHAFERL